MMRRIYSLLLVSHAKQGSDSTLISILQDQGIHSSLLLSDALDDLSQSSSSPSLSSNQFTDFLPGYMHTEDCTCRLIKCLDRNCISVEHHSPSEKSQQCLGLSDVSLHT